MLAVLVRIGGRDVGREKGRGLRCGVGHIVVFGVRRIVPSYRPNGSRIVKP